MPQILHYASTDAHSYSAISGKTKTALLQGKKVPVTEASIIDSGLVISDGGRGAVVIPGSQRTAPNPQSVNARELKLQIRELAEQLFTGIADRSLQKTVALPTSFVNLDNFTSSSSFGRYIAEQMFHELTLRGFAVKEYRTAKQIHVVEGQGEFFLSRDIENVIPANNAVVLSGTYYFDGKSILVNARLIRPNDGTVLRTANMILQSNPLTKKMMANTGKKLQEGVLHIKDYQETTAPQVHSPFDQGEDIH